MRPHRVLRSGSALVLATLMAFPLASPLYAGTLWGKVAADSLPARSQVVATPTSGGGAALPVSANVGADGTYWFSDLEGEYRIEVVGPDGQPLPPASGSAPVVSVSGRDVVVQDLTVGAAAAGAAADQDPSDDAAAAATAPPKGTNVALWATVGGVLGALAIAALVNNSNSDDDDCVPTTSPANPCD